MTNIVVLTNSLKNSKESFSCESNYPVFLFRAALENNSMKRRVFHYFAISHDSQLGLQTSTINNDFFCRGLIQKQAHKSHFVNWTTQPVVILCSQITRTTKRKSCCLAIFCGTWCFV